MPEARHRPLAIGPSVAVVVLRGDPVGCRPASPGALRIHDGTRVFSYSGDTQWTEALLPIASGADLFIVECYDYDRELTGHHWHPAADPDHFEYVGRRNVLFAVERDLHAGNRDTWRLPAFPAEHPSRTPDVPCVRLPAG